MRIMLSSGNDIGFTRKGWAAIGRSIKSQETPSNDGAYWESLDSLAATSVTRGDVETEEISDVVRSPSSSWGGREVPMGVNYSSETRVTLEGNVVIQEQDDEAAKAQIAKDFMDWSHENNKAVDSAIADLKSQLHGEASTDVTAQVTSLSRNPDGTAKVTMVVTITATGGESDIEKKSRLSNERADYEYDRRKDERL